jgi:hypothetical protein
VATNSDPGRSKPRYLWHLGLPRCLWTQKKTAGRSHNLYRDSIDLLGRKSREDRVGALLASVRCPCWTRRRKKKGGEGVSLTCGVCLAVTTRERGRTRGRRGRGSSWAGRERWLGPRGRREEGVLGFGPYPGSCLFFFFCFSFIQKPFQVPFLKISFEILLKFTQSHTVPKI